MTLAVRRRWLLLVLLLLFGVVLGLFWLAYRAGPQPMPPRQWLEANERPRFELATNAAGAITPRLTLSLSNCGPRRVLASAHCLVMRYTPSGPLTADQTNRTHSGGRDFVVGVPHTMASWLMPPPPPVLIGSHQTARMELDLLGVEQRIPVQAGARYHCDVDVVWREPPKAFQFVRIPLERVEIRLLQEGVIDRSWTRTFAGSLGFSGPDGQKLGAELEKLLGELKLAETAKMPGQLPRE